MRERHIGRLLYKFKRSTIPNPNLLINGDFQIAQRGAGPFTSVSTVVNDDDSYLLDQWVFLANGSDTCDVSQEIITVPAGAYSCILLDVETANRKFGIVNFIESNIAAPLLNQTVTLSFQARVTGTSISNIRAGIISWQGTADTITSDIVATWESTGTDPSLVANWTYENTPSNFAVTTSFQQFSVSGIVIDTASTKNVGVFIWVDDTDATVGDFLRIGNVKLEVGSGVTDFVHDTPAVSMGDCQRHLIQINVNPAQNAASGVCGSTTAAEFYVAFPTTMRTGPVLTSSVATGFDVVTTAGHACSAIGGGIPPSSTTGSRLTAVTTGITAGHGCTLFANTTGVFLRFSAEL